ncbi:hypothetical protein, partial [Escherichia coli]|uniref:hypothetical protein n=1 Tax=Escherichia coli TaxID=562 RepID=UPI001962F906
GGGGRGAGWGRLLGGGRCFFLGAQSWGVGGCFGVVFWEFFFLCFGGEGKVVFNYGFIIILFIVINLFINMI